MRRIVNGVEVEFPELTLEVRKEGERFWIRTPQGWKSAALAKQGAALLLSYRGRQYRVESLLGKKSRKADQSSGELKAPMPGLVVAVNVTKGQKVQKGEVLVVLEAMKTQMPLLAPFDGFVEVVNVPVGAQVRANDTLAIVQ